MAAATCLPRETLKKYLVGDVEETQTEAIESHLASCPACEQTVVELESNPETLLVGIRALAENPTPTHDPSLRESPSIVPSVVQHAMAAVRNLPAPATSTASEWPVGQIGAYELLRPLGRGGMGMVVLARHKSLQKEVAIKLLSSLVGDKPELVSRFQREMRAAGRLQHPSIVNATDAGQERGTHYLVMEYIAGLDLSRIARLVGRLSVADACELMRQTALGLSHAHAEGIVHRDIKPSNLMLDASGHLKILDFGLAQINLWDEPVCELTTVGQLMGTIDYMAPEQAERIGAVDYRADLYALGATLFRLIAGRAPLAASPNMTLLEKVRLLGSQTSPLLSSVRDDCPPELVQLVSQLLSRDPAARPASAAHVAEAFEPFCSGSQLAELLAKAQTAAVAEPVPEPAVELVNRSLTQPSSLQFADQVGSAKTPAKPPRSHWLWTAVAAIPLMIFAGVLITLEMQKGQLVIQSDVAGVQIKVARDGKVIDEVTVHPGAQSTRLRADKYEILIDSPSDQVVIDKQQFSIKSGETVVATIRQAGRIPNADASHDSTTLPIANSKVTPDAEELTYDGINYSQWLRKLATDVNEEKQYECLKALYSIGERRSIEDARPIILRVLKDLSQRRNVSLKLYSSAFGVLSKTFANAETYHQFLASEVKVGDELWQSFILESHSRTTHVAPLIDVAKELVTQTGSDRPKAIESAGKYLFYCVRAADSTANEATATILNALEHAPGLTLNFWVTNLFAENNENSSEKMRETFSRVAAKALMNKVSAEDGVRAMMLIERFGDPSNLEWLTPYVSQLVENPDRIARFYRLNRDAISIESIEKANQDNSRVRIPYGEVIDLLRLVLQSDLNSEKQAAARKLLFAAKRLFPGVILWTNEYRKNDFKHEKFHQFLVRQEREWNRLTDTQRGLVVIATAACSLLPDTDKALVVDIECPAALEVGQRAKATITISNNLDTRLTDLRIVISNDSALKAVAVDSPNSPLVQLPDGQLLYWTPSPLSSGDYRQLVIEYQAVAAVEQATLSVKASGDDKVLGESTATTLIVSATSVDVNATAMPDKPSEVRQEPLFEGRTFEQWFSILERDLDIKSRTTAMKAIGELTNKADCALVTERLMALARKANADEWSDYAYVVNLVKFGGRGRVGEVLDRSLIALLIKLNGEAWFQNFLASDLLQGDDIWTARWLAALTPYTGMWRDVSPNIYERFKDKEAFDALGMNSAWLAQAWLVAHLGWQETLTTEDIDHVINLIENQPHLGKMVVLQVDAEICTRFIEVREKSSFIREPNESAQLLVDEAIAKYSKNVLESNESSPEAVARAASRVASTTEIVDSWKPDLLEVIRKRLALLGENHARLTTLLPIDPNVKRRDPFTFPQRNSYGSSSLQLPIPVSNRFTLKSGRGFTEGDDGVRRTVGVTDFRYIGMVPPYIESECVALIATMVRLNGAPECEKELTAIAERTWHDFDSLMTESGSRVLNEPDKAGRQTEPWSKISGETWMGWGIHRVLFEYFVKEKEQLPLLSGVLNRTVLRLTFLQADQDRDGKLSSEELRTPHSTDVDANKDGSLDFQEYTALSKTSPEAAQPGPTNDQAMEFAKRHVGRYDRNGDGKLTVDEWKAMIVAPVAADTDGNGEITVEEYAKFRNR